MNTFGQLTLASIVLSALIFEAAQSSEREYVALLQDAKFAEGFGAAFIYGKEFSGGRRPPLGEVTAYRDISPWRVHLIPHGSVNEIGVKSHPWDFQEGYHRNYKDKAGRFVRELHAHRLVVNHVLEANTDEKLQFAQYNNDGLTKGDPKRNTKLVKRVTTDRNGTLRLYYNSKNEIRNAATAHTAQWANDTWPHFLVNQRMPAAVRLSGFEDLEFTVTYQVDSMQKLSNWPRSRRGVAPPSMNLKFMFFLRNPDDLEQKLFVGMMLYSNNEKRYQAHLGVEQHGNIFYRESVTRDGEGIPQLGESRSVKVDVRELVADALRKGRDLQPELSAVIDSYAIYNFSIGFEGMGHWASEAEISKLSFRGSRIDAIDDTTSD